MGRRSNFAAARNAHHLAVERMGDGSESGEEESDENEEIKFETVSHEIAIAV